jgi:hypothetical protein
MKTPKYETVCEIPKDSECYEAQLRVSLSERGLNAAAEAYVRDEISLMRYKKISDELLEMDSVAWGKLIELSGLGLGADIRIHRIGGASFLQRKVESEAV